MLKCLDFHGQNTDICCLFVEFTGEPLPQKKWKGAESTGQRMEGLQLQRDPHPEDCKGSCKPRALFGFTLPFAVSDWKQMRTCVQGNRFPSKPTGMNM